MLSLGQKVGDYTLISKLGEGGMGVVYEAVHSLIGRRVALKVFHPELAQSPRLAARFLNEARAANQVQHPGLVQVHDYGQDADGAAYLIMELVAGQSLDRRLAAHPGQSLRPAVAVGLAQQVALALFAAHQQGVIHRDVKPANIMLITDAEAPGGERAKVLDFGIAKLLETPDAPRGRTRTGALIGTAEYMSPEQCRGDADIGAAVDVYALGVLLYEMLAGRRPFFAESAVETMTLQLRAAPPPLKDLVPALPATLIGLVHRMLAKQPADRPSLISVADELRRIGPEVAALPAITISQTAALSTVTASDTALPPAPPLTPPRRRHHALLFALVAVGAAVLGAFAWRHRGPAPSPPSSLPAPPAVLAAPPRPVPSLAVAAPAPAVAAPIATPVATPPRAVARKSTAARKQTATVSPLPAAQALPLLMRHKEPDGP